MLLEDSPRLATADGAPIERLGGIESELAIDVKSDVQGARVNFAGSVTRYLTNQFEPTGERIYLDVGVHPEYATAEDTLFLNIAHRVLSGHVKMARRHLDIATDPSNQELERLRLTDLSLFANTYSPSKPVDDVHEPSWASHESYLTRRQLRPEEYVMALAAHQATRIVWSGAGYVAPNRAGGFTYQLSEKAPFMREIYSISTVTDRGLVNTRDEPHADMQNYRRIHNIAGESVFSSAAIALRMASGSIVLRACEIGVNFDDLAPENPVEAMRLISADPTLRQVVAMQNGPRMTGIQIQRAIATRALDASKEADYLTEQEAAYGEKWLQLLDDLEADPELAVRRVDWVVKRRLIDRALSKKRSPGVSDLTLATATALEYHRLLLDEGAGMTLVRKGFFEDSPSNQILENGLALPSTTRAKMRGEAIQALIDAGIDYNADWEVVRDMESNRSMFMAPYENDPEKLRRFITHVLTHKFRK